MGRASSFQPSSLPRLHAVAPDLKAFTAGMPPPTAQKSFGTDLSGQRGFPGGSVGKESACNAGDLGSVPGLGRSLERGTHGYPLQYSGLENSMDIRASWATVYGVRKSQIQLTDFPQGGKETSQGIMNRLPHLQLVEADGSLPA